MTNPETTGQWAARIAALQTKGDVLQTAVDAAQREQDLTAKAAARGDSTAEKPLEAATKKLNTAKAAVESNEAVLRAAQDELAAARAVDAERLAAQGRERLSTLRETAAAALKAFDSQLTAFNRAYATARDVLLQLGQETGGFALRRDYVEDALLTVTADRIAARWSGPQFVAIWESMTDREARQGLQSLAGKFAKSLKHTEVGR